MTKKDNAVREKILKGMELTYTRLIQSKKERNLDLIVSKVINQCSQSHGQVLFLRHLNEKLMLRFLFRNGIFSYIIIELRRRRADIMKIFRPCQSILFAIYLIPIQHKFFYVIEVGRPVIVTKYR